MKISRDDVIYIAKLAKLRFSDEEIEKLTGEFESILNHFQSIDRMDLENIDADNMADGLEPVVRTDENAIFTDREKLFRNAGSMRGTYIQVPRILE
jgi:aspartyl-tRNA(Asn)/glutamyl-tRNA(Gln) amidotransferase subunit C